MDSEAQRVGARHSYKSLTRGERNRLLKAMRAEGVKPPRLGHCVKTLGGEVCRHPASPHLPGDSGYQTIEITVDVRKKPRPLAGAAKGAAAAPERCRTGLSTCMKSAAKVGASRKKAASAVCMREFNKCRRP
jgi:hypothetical protein